MNKLWTIDLENYPIATSTEITCGNNAKFITRFFDPVRTKIVDFNDYFNSEVLVMNLELILEKLFEGGELFKQCIEILYKNPKMGFLDQDALNFIFNKNCKKLPAGFNLFVNVARRTFKFGREIYHFANSALQNKSSDKFNRLWFSYFVKTPFCSPESFDNFNAEFVTQFESIKTKIDDRFALIRKLITRTTEGRRIFFAHPKEISNIKNIFELTQGKIFIDATYPKAIEILLASLHQNNSQQSKIKPVFFYLC